MSKAGVFYTPQIISELFAANVYDPSAGSGSVLTQALAHIRITGCNTSDLDMGCYGGMILKNPPMGSTTSNPKNPEAF